jgi:hypothetical protein
MPTTTIRDIKIPDGPYTIFEDFLDDLTYAKQIMAKLTDVHVTRG